MQNFKLTINPNSHKKDLTIIYKEGEDHFHELKVSKDEILKSLRYFAKKNNEINLTNLIYIEEKISFDIFSSFISSISTNEIEINENNYSDYYYFSCKYEYNELRSRIEEFIDTRPDVFSIANELSNKIPNQTELVNSSIDYLKEEIIAKNIDVSIKNKFLDNIPTDILIRILNHPKRVVKNHHLLFSFVVDLMKKKAKNENMMKKEENEESLMILPSCLDYQQMSSSEIEELFSIQNFDSPFQPRNSAGKIRELISSEKEMERKCLALEERMNQVEKLFAEKNRAYDESIKRIEGIQQSAMKRQESLEETVRQHNNRVSVNEEAVKEMKAAVESAMKDKSEQIIRNEEMIGEVKDAFEKNCAQQNLKISASEEAIKEIKEAIGERKNELEMIKASLSEVKKEQQSIKAQAKEASKLTECKDGIFHYLFEKYKTNPANIGIVEITGNSISDGNSLLLPKIIDSNWRNDWWQSKDEKNSYIRIDFRQSLVKINKYRIKVGDTDGGRLFTSWTLKGFTDDNREIVLDEVSNSKQITKSNPSATVEISNEYFVRSIQIAMKGEANNSPQYSMRFRNIELFGCIKDK